MSFIHFENPEVTMVEVLVSLMGYAGWSVKDGVPFFHEDAPFIPTPEAIQAEFARLQPLKTAAIQREHFKNQREVLVEKIKVTVDGMEFDGDEKSQERMARAIMLARERNSPVIPLWVLANNQPVFNLPIATMVEALYQAGIAQTNLWVQPGSPPA